MVTIFNKTFPSVTAALMYMGWTEESGKVLPAPEMTGNDYSGTVGTYEYVHIGVKETVVWVRDNEALWEKHAVIKGVYSGILVLDGERLADVALRQAIDMEGDTHVLLSVWSPNTVSGGPGFINFPLRDRLVMEAEAMDEEGVEQYILALSVEGNVLVFAGNAFVAREAKLMAYHLLKQ